LERAFSASVAYWAIEGVVDEEEFKDTFTIFVDLFGVGIDDHVVAGGESAGGLGFWHFADGAVWLFESDFDEAHPAHADRFHARVVAENRNFKAESFHGFDDEFVFWNLKFNIVDRDGDQLFLCYRCHGVTPGLAEVFPSV